MNKIRIAWLTGHSFIDVDESIVPELSEYFSIRWIVIRNMNCWYSEDTVNKIFKNEIERGECFKREYFEYSFVQCENSSLPIFEKNIKFKFGNMITTVSIKQLFREQSNHWESIINANPYMLYDDAVIMGVRFMQLFNLSVFDYEKKEMRFYSDTTEIEMNDTMPSVNAGTNKILCIFLMVICLANIALFVLHLKVKDEDL